MCRVSSRSPRSSSSSAASRTILLTRPLFGGSGVAGAPTPPPAGAETPISGSAGDEEPQQHFGATSGIRISKNEKKKDPKRCQRKNADKNVSAATPLWEVFSLVRVSSYSLKKLKIKTEGLDPDKRAAPSLRSAQTSARFQLPSLPPLPHATGCTTWSVSSSSGYILRDCLQGVYKNRIFCTKRRASASQTGFIHCKRGRGRVCVSVVACWRREVKPNERRFPQTHAGPVVRSRGGFIPNAPACARAHAPG